MRFKPHLFLVAGCFLAAPSILPAEAPPQKDYLTAVEADKIRDAETTNERVKLFLSFADDRLKKFQYEIEPPSAAWTTRRTSSSWGSKNRKTSGREST